MKFFFLTLFTLLFLAPVTVFAGEADHGVIGALLVDALSDIPVLGRLALVVYGIVVWAIVRGAQVVFARMPTRWGEFGASIGWQVLAFFFGKDILLHQAEPDPECEEEAREKIRESLIKEYPVLQIKPPWEK